MHMYRKAVEEHSPVLSLSEGTMTVPRDRADGTGLMWCFILAAWSGGLAGTAPVPRLPGRFCAANAGTACWSPLCCGPAHHVDTRTVCSSEQMLKLNM